MLDPRPTAWAGSSARRPRMPRATEICDTDPNNPCCRSCAQREGHAARGCFALSNDKSCKDKPASMALHDLGHASRLAQPALLQAASALRFRPAVSDVAVRGCVAASPIAPAVEPPMSRCRIRLYDPGDTGKRRDSSLVVLAGIVGVPWQDLADDASQTGAGLSYLSASELDQRSRWEYLLGTPDASPVVPPNDPIHDRDHGRALGVEPARLTARPRSPARSR